MCPIKISHSRCTKDEVVEMGIEDKKKEKPELRSIRTSRWRGNGHIGHTSPSEEYLGCSRDGGLVNAGRSEDERF
jgi:hypothetical protein